MRLDLDGAPKSAHLGSPVEVGHVYKTQKGLIYVIVAIHNGNAAALQVNPIDGTVTGAVSYGENYFAHRPLLGVVTNLPDILEIDWV